MKKLIYLLLTLPLLFTSCQNDEQVVSEETVQVSFTAGLPQQMGTRASSTTPSVDKLYCAVFENGVEIQSFRQEIDITSQNMVFAPRLIKGRTYNIAFWASKDGAYNVSNMEEITRNTGVEEENFDAFTACTSITVEGNASQSITLHRPLAQLNLGVTPEDWEGVANQYTFGMIPKNITLTIEGKDTFNALQSVATGIDRSLTYNLTVSGAEFTCNGETYKNIAMCYVLAESEKQTNNVSYSIYDQDGDAIQENASIIHVPLQQNYKTNVVGGLLTGNITYSISFDDVFLTDNDHNKEIE